MTVESILIASNFIMLSAFGSILIVHVWMIKANHKKDKEFLKAFMARNLPEFDHSEVLERNKGSTTSTVPENEFVPSENVSDELFKKAISRELGLGGEE